jgi:hypothetical protein
MSELFVILNLNGFSRAPFHCDSLRCEAKGKLCCRRYHAIITDEESRRINEILPQIRELPGVDVEALQQPPFKRIEEDTIEILHSSKHNACAFLSYNEKGAPICGIHATCIKLGLDHREYKPFGCRLFPLDVTERTEDKITVSIHPDSPTFPCLTDFAHEGQQLLEDLAKEEMSAGVVIWQEKIRG